MEAGKKKILFVITKSVWGGAGRYVYDLATTLPKNDFTVSVALGGDGALSEKLRAAGISVVSLAKMQRDLSVGADLGGFASLCQVLKSLRPDIVHLNSSKAGGLGALAARLLGVPRIIFTAHGWPFEEKKNILWRSFAWLGSWATALLSHAVIVVSERDFELGEKMPGCRSKMHMIHNGIENGIEFGSGEFIRSAFPSGVRITGTVGELTRNKNQLSLIEQARQTPDMYVAIVGEGEDRGLLESKIREYGLEARVKLFGFIPARDVMKGFDTFSLPSLKEGLPYVLLEAKAAGLPIQANRVGGVGEILDAADMSDFTLEQMVRKTVALY